MSSAAQIGRYHDYGQEYAREVAQPHRGYDGDETEALQPMTRSQAAAYSCWFVLTRHLSEPEETKAALLQFVQDAGFRVMFPRKTNLDLKRTLTYLETIEYLEKNYLIDIDLTRSA